MAKKKLNLETITEYVLNHFTIASLLIIAGFDYATTYPQVIMPQTYIILGIITFASVFFVDGVLYGKNKEKNGTFISIVSALGAAIVVAMPGSIAGLVFASGVGAYRALKSLNIL